MNWFWKTITEPLSELVELSGVSGNSCQWILSETWNVANGKGCNKIHVSNTYPDQKQAQVNLKNNWKLAWIYFSNSLLVMKATLVVFLMVIKRQSTNQVKVFTIGVKLFLTKSNMAQCIHLKYSPVLLCVSFQYPPNRKKPWKENSIQTWNR